MKDIIKEAYIKGYKKGYRDATCKPENKPADERKCGGWISISAKDVGAENDDLRHEIALLKDAQLFLETRIKKLERAFWGE